MDLRLDKVFRFGQRQAFELSAQVFNLFNSDNFTGYEQFIPPLPEVNAELRRAEHARTPSGACSSVSRTGSSRLA